MRRIFYFVLSAILFIQITACQTYSSVSFELEFEESAMAKKEDGQWKKVSDQVFQKGDIVGMVLLNVSGFKKDDSGKNWVELGVEIKDSEGNIVLSQEDLLGEAGKKVMENNTEESLIGLVDTSKELEPGKYHFKLKVYDKIGGGKIESTRSFTLK